MQPPSLVLWLPALCAQRQEPAVADLVPAVRPTALCCACAEIGVVLTGLGFVFSFLGIMFFFDRGLIALGNVRPDCTSIVL